MKIRIWVLITLFLLGTFMQPGFASLVSREELSGRGQESPVGILSIESVIYVAFREPAALVRYNTAWVEMGVLGLPESFVPSEMIEAGSWIWILDERSGVILQIDPIDMEIAATFSNEYNLRFIAIFEANGHALVMDDQGSVHQVDEEFTAVGWISGLRLYQSAVFDGYHIYLGGRIEPAMSGVLVKTQEDMLEDEWRMSDDRRAPVETDVVERVRLLEDGFFYVVYKETGIVKYDEFGSYRNRFYRRSSEERTFMDIEYVKELDQYFMVDQQAGVFEVKWSRDRTTYRRKADVDTSGHRLTVRTVRGLMEAQIGAGRLKGFYDDEDAAIQVLLPTREADRLKLRIEGEDLLAAIERGMDTIKVHWNDEQYAFSLSDWGFYLHDEESIEEQYVEIEIVLGEITVDFCMVERLDEKTKTVRRENLE